MKSRRPTAAPHGTASTARKKNRHRLTFFRQERYDGGSHTGIDVDDETVLESRQEPAEDYDSALVWWVDVRCEGENLPADPVQARDWFLDHAAELKAALEQVADKVEVGFDPDGQPYLWEAPRPPRGVQVTIMCHACHRLAARTIAAVLHDLVQHWEKRLKALELAMV